jgi:hypothetical protein
MLHTEDYDPPDLEGFWIARHGDGTGIVPFLTEIEALRYAVENTMKVEFVRFGEPF